MAKRAKRASRVNPREDRNYSESTQYRNPKGRREPGDNRSTNVIDFPHISKKKHIEIIPRNINQEDMMASLEDESKHIVFAVGPAGSGKTLLATLHAIKSLKDGLVQKIVITRPNVAVDDNDIGYLPGDILQKMAPWIMPFTDILSEYYSQKEITHMLEENIIEVVPVAYIRGRTFKNAIVIVDEAQGTTINSMKSILTRIGDNCRLIVTGDIRQTDRGACNGLADFMERLKAAKPEGIDIIEFSHKDVVRHPIIETILKLYGEE